MSKRMKLFALAAAGVLVLVVGGAFAWYEFIRDDAPAEVSLAGALDTLNQNASATPGASTTASASATSDTTSAEAAGTLDGAWTVDASLGSFVGYRVGEELARVGVTTAVGRTTAVTGDLLVENSTVQSATITADMTKLTSDSNMRDGQLRRQGIETDTYPTSTFELTAPVELPDTIADGLPFTTTLVGNLTLHGVTREVSIPAEAQLSGDNLVVVGSLEIVFADYAIEKPSGASVVSIEDTGVMELQLFFARSGA